MMTDSNNRSVPLVNSVRKILRRNSLLNHSYVPLKLLKWHVLPCHTQTHTHRTKNSQKQLQLESSNESSIPLSSGMCYLHYSMCFQRELNVKASSAPMTPACQPPPTVTVSRSVQTVPMSTTVVSDAIKLPECTVANSVYINYMIII